MSERAKNYTLMVEQRPARVSLGGTVVAGFLLGCTVSVYAAEPQPVTPSGVLVSDLEGIWEQVQEFETFTCTSLTLTISGLGDAQLAFRADERMQCDGDKQYILHYSGTLLQNNGRFFISLIPISKDAKMKPVEPVGDAPDTYSPDRLTLWLSRDGCKLVGSRDETRSPPQGVGYLTVKKHGCS
jgi:hypothetical protein